MKINYPCVVYILYPVDTVASSSRKQSVPVCGRVKGSTPGSPEVSGNPSGSECLSIASSQHTVMLIETVPLNTPSDSKHRLQIVNTAVLDVGLQ